MQRDRQASPTEEPSSSPPPQETSAGRTRSSMKRGEADNVSEIGLENNRPARSFMPVFAPGQ